MRKFLCRLLTFLIPFYLVGMIGAWFYYLGYQIGEFRNFDQMIEAQREDHSILIGMGYNEQALKREICWCSSVGRAADL